MNREQDEIHIPPRDDFVRAYAAKHPELPIEHVGRLYDFLAEGRPKYKRELAIFAAEQMKPKESR